MGHGEYVTVRTFNPAVQVRLIKLIARKDAVAQRYADADREVDLTPYLGERGVVQTQKSVRTPAGSFSVSFPDQPDRKTGDTVYALAEPMDVIEIRAARQPHLYAGGKLPLIMRGFVSSVTRSESMAGGRPQRSVTIQGQDAGKLWLINQVFFRLAAVLERPMLTAFQLQAATGFDVRPMPVAEFMEVFTRKVMNPKVETLSGFAGKAVSDFAVQATVPDGEAVPQLIASLEGPLWSYVELYADRPWNEVYVDHLDASVDTDEGPTLFHRPAPFKNLDGDYIIPGAKDPGTVALDIAQVVSLAVSRSDGRIANLFWVPPAGTELTTGQMLQAATVTEATKYDLNHDNNRPELYGVRQMQAETRLLPNNIAGVPARLPTGQQAATGSDIIAWFALRADQLRQMNEDNGVFEEGAAVVQGSELLRAGKYVRLTRGGLFSDYYVPTLSHTIPALEPWTTELVLERGTGFLDRAATDGAPAYLEGFAGPYSP